MTDPSRRTFIAGSAALAATAACDIQSHSQATRITGGTESAFPSANAPGSNEGGYNILFILTDQEHSNFRLAQDQRFIVSERRTFLEPVT